MPIQDERKSCLSSAHTSQQQPFPNLNFSYSSPLLLTALLLYIDNDPTLTKQSLG